ncbi:MAG TPA: aldo/keto reductase [Thermotogota bacterium]|nr:aldo/keto reductase [Thermotogota bacterium]
MNFREFGKTGEKLSAIGLGCMGMSMSYGTPNDAESLATLRRSLELGINFWDTADIYGDGVNEELIAPVLHENRNQIFLATKFGFRKNAEAAAYLDGSVKWVRQAVEGSLKRLKIETIDLYYLHRVDPKTPVEETVDAMAQLVKEGKIRYIGLSECTVEDLKRANAVHPISAVQSEYSLVERTVERNGILELTKEIGAAFVPFAPLGRGLITSKLNLDTLKETDFRYNIPRYNGEHRKNNEDLVTELTDFAKTRFNATTAQLSLAWVLAQGDHIIPIPGTKRRKYLEENAAAVDVQLCEEDLNTIDAILKRYPNIGERYALRESKFIKK